MTVLVVYSSRNGATGGIAERVAARLKGSGIQAEALPASATVDPEAYQAVVVGSAVYYGAWMKDAAEFVRSNRAALAERPVWLFSSGPTGDLKGEQKPPREIAEFTSSIEPVDHRIFAGALDRDRLTAAQRVLCRLLRAPLGDFRDWADIDAWADGIAHALARPTAATTTSSTTAA